jgi:hypothetical protein
MQKLVLTLVPASEAPKAPNPAPRPREAMRGLPAPPVAGR